MNPEAVLQLLQIAALARQWQNLNALHDLAMADLTQAASEAKTELEERAAEVKAKAEAEAAKMNAKAKADAEPVRPVVTHREPPRAPYTPPTERREL